MDILIIITALMMSHVGYKTPDFYYAEQIVRAAECVSPNLRQDVILIIAIESSFKPKATSSVGARGLMQLMPIAVKEVGNQGLCNLDGNPKDIYDIETNITYGSCYYEYLMLRYKNRDEALIAYNGGHRAVMAYRNGAPYKESTNYLKRFKHLLNLLPTTPEEK